MSFTYGVRAAILCFGFFFLLHAALGFAVSVVASWRIFERISPRSAAHAHFLLRVLPVTFALILTCMVVAPAYFQWERKMESEPVGVVITLAAACAIFIWFQSLVRSARALYESFSVRQEILETGDLFLAIAGMTRPQIIISRGFLETIPDEHREVAMRHELAHFRAADNLKRLLMLLAPPILPAWNLGFVSLEDGWARYSERAADDEAVDGDQNRATLLAEVLVLMARKRCCNQPPLVCSLVGSTVELSTRIERLCSESDLRKRSQNRALALVSAALLLSPVVLAALAHGVSEQFFHWIEHLLLHA